MLALPHSGASDANVSLRKKRDRGDRCRSRSQHFTDSRFESKVLDFKSLMNFQIRRAKPEEAGALTEIAHAAKRHWGYPENWIQLWQADLTITPEFIAENEVYVATNGDQIAGCCAIAFTEEMAELEHMWIRPEHIGRGVGRALFNHVKGRATELKIPAFEISSDPNAEGFYERMGATRIGEVQSEIEGKPRALPRMKVNVRS
jgi:N-acetylglutamate synthase-like GNAT family acetyltransferase